MTCDTVDQIFDSSASVTRDMTGQIIGSSSAAVTRYAQEISSLFTSSLARVRDSNKDFHSKFVTSAYYACYCIRMPTPKSKLIRDSEEKRPLQKLRTQWAVGSANTMLYSPSIWLSHEN